MWKYLLILVIIIGIGCMGEKKQSKMEKDKSILDEFELFGKIDKERDTIDLEILAQQFKDKKTPFRQNALVKLNERNYPSIEELLEASLSDEDKMIRIIAIQTIKENKQFKSLEVLMEMFTNSNDHLILTNLCKTFAEFQDKKPIPIILDKLNSQNELQKNQSKKLEKKKPAANIVYNACDKKLLKILSYNHLRTKTGQVESECYDLLYHQ